MTKFRCRLCRHFLFSAADLLNPKGDKFDDVYGLREDGCSDTQWFLDYTTNLDWLKCCFVQNNYSKGKLSCPHCSGRVGSFDFVKSVSCDCGRHALPYVRVSRNRVDVDYPVEFSIRQTNSIRPIRMMGGKSKSSENSTKSPYSLDKQSSEDSRNTAGSTNFTQDINDEIDGELMCPICLEVYYLPHKCLPCKHVFCSPCLRRLNGSRSEQTKCPLCRVIIQKCLPEYEKSNMVKMKYFEEYKNRRNAEGKVAHTLPQLPSLVRRRKINNRPRSSNITRMLAPYAGVVFVLLLCLLAAVILFITFSAGIWLAWQLILELYLSTQDALVHNWRALVVFVGSQRSNSSHYLNVFFKGMKHSASKAIRLLASSVDHAHEAIEGVGNMYTEKFNRTSFVLSQLIESAQEHMHSYNTTVYIERVSQTGIGFSRILFAAAAFFLVIKLALYIQRNRMNPHRIA